MGPVHTVLCCFADSEAGTPRTHRRFLGRADGSYGPIPSRRPLGMLGMPMNRTAIKVCTKFAVTQMLCLSASIGQPARGVFAGVASNVDISRADAALPLVRCDTSRHSSPKLTPCFCLEKHQV